MSDVLRARIVKALNTTAAAQASEIPEPVQHDGHRYDAYCALCRGEAETLADAVIAALADLLPGDVDAHAVEQAKRGELDTRQVSTSQAAEILGVSRPTLVRFLEDGRLPYTQPGTHRRVLLADVLALKAAVTHA